MHHTSNTKARWPRRLRWLMIAVAAALAVASSTAGATASTQASTQESVDVAVVSYATEYGVSHQEALRRLDRIQPLQDILSSIRSLETARLAGWGIDHTAAFTGWVWLTGDQPPSAETAAIADAHTDVQVRTGAAHTRAELLAAQSALFNDAAAARVVGGAATVEAIKRIVTFTDIDMRDNAISIGIDPSKADPLAVSDQALREKATQVRTQLDPSVDVNFNVRDGRGIALEESFGGGEEVRLENGSYVEYCTSGFAAQKNGTGKYGIITAGHCGSDGPTENWTTSMHDIDLPHNYGWKSFNADAQFHTIPTGSSHKLRDDYQCEIHRRRAWCDVTGDISRSNMINDWVCHTGRSSGITCGKVVSIDVKPKWGSCLSSSGNVIDCNNVFVSVTSQSLRSCGGDSGGPWYRNGVAYGIHMSSNSKDDCNKSGIHAYFSGIREVENFLRVQILTDGSVTVS